jgi:GTP:adenosylcobinamide-phosphate guanylyltransferase
MSDAAPHCSFLALVLAGDRGTTDPLLAQSEACCKAMIEIDGTPMVLRVLSALRSAECIEGRLLSGPKPEQLAIEPEVHRLVESGEISWCEPRGSPSTSASHAMETIDGDTPVLITTADHPLLSASIIDHFCRQSAASDADLTVGLAPHRLVAEAFPEMKKTVLRFRDEHYCGCNLFAFMTPQARGFAEHWRQVESDRKNPLKMIRLLGWGAVLRYLLGQLSLDDALESLSRKFGLRIRPVILPYAEAAVDVDSVRDHYIVQEKLTSKAGQREAG